MKHVVFILAFVWLDNNARSQDTAIIARSKILYSRWSFYGFYDVVRTAGVSAAYRPSARFECELALAGVYPYSPMKNIVSANDYFDNLGGGSGLSCKFRFIPHRRFYMGVSLWFYDYGYKNKWTESGIIYDKYSARYAPHELRDRRTVSKCFSILWGYTLPIKKYSVEAYFAIGSEATSNYVLVHRFDKAWYPWYKNPPYSYRAEAGQPNIQLGIKIGFNKKKIETAPFKIYRQVLTDRLKKEESAIDRLMAEGKITQEEYWDGYEIFKSKELDKLRAEYNWKKNDVAYMTAYTRQIFEEIADYIEKKFGFRYMHLD